MTGGRGVIYLHGDLGAGKTTLSRGLIRGFGHEGESEPDLHAGRALRTGRGRCSISICIARSIPKRLEFLGIRDYFEGNALCLISGRSAGPAFCQRPTWTLPLRRMRPAERCACRPIPARGEALGVSLTDESYE